MLIIILSLSTVEYNFVENEHIQLVFWLIFTKLLNLIIILVFESDNSDVNDQLYLNCNEGTYEGGSTGFMGDKSWIKIIGLGLGFTKFKTNPEPESDLFLLTRY